MTLVRLLLACLPVVVWFVAIGWVTHRWIGMAASPPLSGAGLGWIAAEALLLTLFGSLWFDSLGHGGWWVLFGLLGLLATRLPARPAFVTLITSVVRYLGAGALLAWRLG